MVDLKFGQRNGLHSTLRELALQTEELAGLLERHNNDLRIIPVDDALTVPERQRWLIALKNIQKEIEDMRVAFGIDFDARNVSRKLYSSRVYMEVVIKNVLPSNFRGYGDLSPAIESLLVSHIRRILESLNNI
jgi:hypothetical protein